MSKIEDVLYEAHRRGIKSKVLDESTRLSKQAKYKHLEVGDRLEVAFNNIVEMYEYKSIKQVMEKVSKRIWSEYMEVKGGDFSNWYDSLSPIENYLFNKQLRIK